MTEAEVIRLPSKRNGWLIKSIVPDAGSLGAVAIEAAKSTFLLTRNPGRLVHTVNTVSRIKGSGKNFHEPKTTRTLCPKRVFRSRLPNRTL